MLQGYWLGPRSYNAGTRAMKRVIATGGERRLGPSLEATPLVGHLDG